MVQIGTQREQKVEQCIRNCVECQKSCLETAIHCLDMGGKHAAREHQTLLLDCADICRTAADFMIRGSDHHPRICGVCAELCEACGEQCENMASGDQLMKSCADICRTCAQSCREMAGRM